MSDEFPTAEAIVLAIQPDFACDILQALRLCYYVKGHSAVPDHIYDQAEKEYLNRESTDTFSNPLNEPGSDCYEHYPERIKALAIYLQLCTHEQFPKKAKARAAKVKA